MIKVERLCKKFGEEYALKEFSCDIPSGCVFGLVGSNGAGKSTLLRLIAGVYEADGGRITVDGNEVFENADAKNKIVFVSDELYFMPQTNLYKMAKLYSAVYKNFSDEKFETLLKEFELDGNANINTFSKGMRRQAAIILALAAQPKYLLLDETFDGLDVIMRAKVRKEIYKEVADREMTVVLASHSLRELEDTCDKLAMIHGGKLIFESDTENIKTSLFKVQVAFSESFGKEKFDFLDVVEYAQKGSVANMIIRGDKEEAKEKLEALSPSILDVLPLSLEEIFTHEMEAIGYSEDNRKEEKVDENI